VLLGTNKMAAFSGTSVAAYQYAKRVNFHYPLLFTVIAGAFAGSFSGAKVVSYLPVNYLKPLVLFILIGMAWYTYKKKDFGSAQKTQLLLPQQILVGLAVGLVIGFYDGFFGPGTGSFLVMSFVYFLGFDFLSASAYAKIVNCVTNLGALIVFISHENYILYLALSMAIANTLGSWLGAKTALKRGNKFIRQLFLLVVSILIFRYAYDVWQLINS
ncbi:MAG: sulfite exporter TauE/SafE family protein, partial [Chitinophagaceae bacterium]